MCARAMLPAMTWIDTIDLTAARGKLAQLYAKIRSPRGQIDNILKAHSLRPRTLEAHLALYRAVLHSRPRELTPRECELIGVCVSLWNGCTYCVRHHLAGLKRILGNDGELADRLVKAATQPGGGPELSERERALCRYAEKLTRQPSTMAASDLEPLRSIGVTDAGILELNQVTAYFAYANRTVLGLGVEIAGEVLGEHPDQDSDEPFRHG